MSRILFIQWNKAEAHDRARRLRAAGHTVTVHWDSRDAAALRKLRARPMDAMVIDLGRIPSQGQAVATWFRQQKATREVPIVLVDGDPAKVEKIRRLLPDATYTPWSRVRNAIRGALRSRPKAAVVPDTMAGYSGTPLVKKLGIKPGARLMLLGAPDGFEKTLAGLPDGVRIKRQARGVADIVMLFSKSKSDLAGRLAVAKRAMADGAGLWLAWPKQASGVSTDLTGNVVRATGLADGLVDYKICAIDATWSGLLFARRRSRK